MTFRAHGYVYSMIRASFLTATDAPEPPLAARDRRVYHTLAARVRMLSRTARAGSYRDTGHDFCSTRGKIHEPTAAEERAFPRERKPALSALPAGAPP